MPLSALLAQAFQQAVGAADQGNSPGEIHKNRSRNWVNFLAVGFQQAFANHPHDVRVFWRGNPANEEFRLNELLYDVHVCETATVPHEIHPGETRYIVSPLWQIESEFSRSEYEALKDFNKLIVGSGETKLFIGPQLPNAWYLPTLRTAATSVGGQVFLALVPHPDQWHVAHPGITLLRFNNGDWVQGDGVVNGQ